MSAYVRVNGVRGAQTGIMERFIKERTGLDWVIEHQHGICGDKKCAGYAVRLGGGRNFFLEEDSFAALEKLGLMAEMIRESRGETAEDKEGRDMLSAYVFLLGSETFAEPPDHYGEPEETP